MESNHAGAEQSFEKMAFYEKSQNNRYKFMLQQPFVVIVESLDELNLGKLIPIAFAQKLKKCGIPFHTARAVGEKNRIDI